VTVFLFARKEKDSASLFCTICADVYMTSCRILSVFYRDKNSSKKIRMYLKIKIKTLSY
jgi:hypothetical protein